MVWSFPAFRPTAVPEAAPLIPYYITESLCCKAFSLHVNKGRYLYRPRIAAALELSAHSIRYIAMLNHGVCPIARDNDMIHNNDPDTMQQFLNGNS